MRFNGNIKRVCSFCVSDWHFITMITPYINEKIQNKENIKIYSAQNKQKTVKTFLSKLNINHETKKKIADLNWNESKINKYSKIEEEFGSVKESNIIAIVIGDNAYIERVNHYIEKWAKENTNKKITIANCYEVMQFNQNIEEILRKHDKILNTSGEKEISEVFEGFSAKEEGVS